VGPDGRDPKEDSRKSMGLGMKEQIEIVTH
jgi:hypothetical protein